MFSSKAIIMSNSTTSLSAEEPPNSCVSSGTRVQDFAGLFHNTTTTTNNTIIVSSTFNNTNTTNNIIHDHHHHQQHTHKLNKKKRSLPGNPDPDAEVIALSPKTLLATNRFVCEICNKGFQRDQNLQLHRRGHNLPWKLKQRNNDGKDQIKKRAYVCPDPTCVHHHPSRALGDLTGIKKHFCRKHGEKKWKCDKCTKIYAVQSDWKAHTKTCGTREYRCDCGTLFSRKDSFITHRAFCDALAEESARLSAAAAIQPLFPFPSSYQHHNFASQPSNHINNNHITLCSPCWDPPLAGGGLISIKPESFSSSSSSADHHSFPIAPATTSLVSPPLGIHVAATSSHLSATALLQKAATVGAQPARTTPCHVAGVVGSQVPRELIATWQKSSDRLTRDFLGLAAPDHQHRHHQYHNQAHAVNVSVDMKEVLNHAGGAELTAVHQNRIRDQPPQGFGFAEAAAAAAGETWTDC